MSALTHLKRRQSGRLTRSVSWNCGWRINSLKNYDGVSTILLVGAGAVTMVLVADRRGLNDTAGGGRGRNDGTGGGRGLNDTAGGGRGQNGSAHYGQVKQPAESDYASVKCTGCLCYGHLATACPRQPVPEVHMAEIYNSNVRELCGENTCNACHSDENARINIIIDNGCCSHMVSVWRGFRNFRTKTAIQVNCANGQLIGASGVGDAGFLTGVLLVPHLKKNLSSEGN